MYISQRNGVKVWTKKRTFSDWLFSRRIKKALQSH